MVRVTYEMAFFFFFFLMSLLCFFAQVFGNILTWVQITAFLLTDRVTVDELFLLSEFAFAHQ